MPIAEDVDNVTDCTPSPLYVDATLLPRGNRIGNGPVGQTAYRIKDTVFYESDVGTAAIDSSLVQFELYAEINGVEPGCNMENCDDVYCSTPTESESEIEEYNECDTTILPTFVQPVPHGVVINSNVFLTKLQWNTVVGKDSKLMHCAVCNMVCDVDSCQGHIGSEMHRNLMDMYKPLKLYDLSIVREIRNSYHCGVCNVLFKSNAKLQHFDSKSHEENILYAMNKVSDVMFDLDLHGYHDRADTYHFNENNRGNNGISNDGSSYSDDLINFNDEFGSNDRFINYENNDEYDEEYEIDEPPVSFETSYATMAKKPRTRVVKKFVEIDFQNKVFTVDYDSWNMITNTKCNIVYCMACKKYYHISDKLNHCEKFEHLEKLKTCEIIEAIDQYFIRNVDHRLHHCGKCNNLQLINEIEDHIQLKHPRKAKLNHKSAETVTAPLKINDNGKNNVRRHTGNDAATPVKSYNDNGLVKRSGTPVKLENTVQPFSNNNGAVKRSGTPVKIENKVQKPFVKAIAPPNGLKANASSNKDTRNNVSDMLPGIFDTVVIYPFQYKMTIPSMSYNVVCQRVTDFYCGLCDFICSENIIGRHIYEIRHIDMLRRTPFIQHFQCSLIRAIREKLHCAVCNMPVNADQIYVHVKDPMHENLLRKALGPMNGNGIPKPPTPTVPNVAPETRLPTNNVKINKNDYQVAQGSVNDTPAVVNDTHAVVNDTKAVFNETRVNANKEVPNDINDEISASDDEDDEIFSDHDDDLDDTFDSAQSDDVPFDMEEYVYLKLKNTFIKISNTSYNTLVHVGDGSRYCFVCSVPVDYQELQKHVDSRGHMDNMEEHRFVDKYQDHLVRQLFLTYHCGICNVLVNRKDIKPHLDWPTHALQYDYTINNIKKTRKTEIKGGVKQIVVSTQKENIYLYEKETKLKVCLDVVVSDEVKAVANESLSSSRDLSLNRGVNQDASNSIKKNKIIIFNDNVLKFAWESWHGISKIKNGYKCNLCQRDLRPGEIDTHCSSEWHGYALSKPFETQYAPALIRKINELTLNCLMCNTEVSNKEHLVQEHINGKKHAKHYEAILKDSSRANTYTDCNDDVLTL